MIALKWNNLLKHAGCTKAEVDQLNDVKVGEYYFRSICKHRQNQVLYTQRNIAIVSQLVCGGISGERSRKKVQFSTAFHLLSKGRSMLQYKESHALFKHLGVKNRGRVHWSHNAGWEIAAALHECVLQATKECISKAHFLSFTVDEVTIADNQNWLSVHAYFVKDWVRVLILLSLTRLVEGVASENLMQCCIDALEEYGGVPPEKLTFLSPFKFLFFFAMPSVRCILIP